MEQRTQKTRGGTLNSNNKGIEFKTLRKGVKLRIPSRRNSESREKENGTWKYESKGMEFKTLRMAGRTWAPLPQKHGTQKAENKVMVKEIPRTRESNSQSQVHGGKTLESEEQVEGS